MISDKLFHFYPIFLTLLLCLTLAACNNDSDDDDDSAPGAVWTAPASGLTWQNGAVGDFEVEWDEAPAYCENLVWNKYDDWRLPSIDEFRTLIRGCPATETDDVCAVADSCLDSDCWSGECQCAIYEGPGTDGRYWPAEITGEEYSYWTKYAVADDENDAWAVNFGYGAVGYNGCDGLAGVRCVR